VSTMPCLLAAGRRYWEDGSWHPLEDLVGRRVLCSRKGRAEWTPPAVGTVRSILPGPRIEVVWDGCTFHDEMETLDLTLLPSHEKRDPSGENR
jgi:hypothetical protein